MESPSLIYENENFIAVQKPAGLMVHAARVSSKRRVDAARSQSPTLVDWIIEKYPEVKTVGDDPALRPGIVHRLDKETSGIMIIARNQRTFEFLKGLFEKRAIEKTYLALVFGKPKPEEGIIEAAIGIRNGTLKRSVHSQKMAKAAVTEYRTLRTSVFRKPDGKEVEYSLLEVKPKTGRTHQIRVHLASIGNPILGDVLYGPKKQPEFVHRLMLHARSIAFSDASGSRFEFEAPPPPDFAQ